MRELLIQKVELSKINDEYHVNIFVSLEGTSHEVNMIRSESNSMCRPGKSFPLAIERSLFPKHLALIARKAVDGMLPKLPISIQTEC